MPSPPCLLPPCRPLFTTSRPHRLCSHLSSGRSWTCCKPRSTTLCAITAGTAAVGAASLRSLCVLSHLTSPLPGGSPLRVCISGRFVVLRCRARSDSPLFRHQPSGLAAFSLVCSISMPVAWRHDHGRRLSRGAFICIQYSCCLTVVDASFCRYVSSSSCSAMLASCTRTR